jgi:hypothetical protein
MHLGVALRGLSGPDTYTRVASIRIRTTSSTPGMTRDIQPDGACTDTAAGRVCWRHVHSHNLPRHSDPSQAAIEYYQYWVFSILPVPTLDIYILIISRFRRRTLRLYRLTVIAIGLLLLVIVGVIVIVPVRSATRGKGSGTVSTNFGILFYIAVAIPWPLLMGCCTGSANCLYLGTILFNLPGPAGRYSGLIISLFTGMEP